MLVAGVVTMVLHPKQNAMNWMNVSGQIHLNTVTVIIGATMLEKGLQ